MIGRGKTKTNHIGREGLKRVKFCREEGQPMRHFGNKTGDD